MEKDSATVSEHTIKDSLRFGWCLPGKLAGSARPGRYGDLGEDLLRLRAEGIAVIVNLCSQPIEFPPEMAGWFEELHEPVQDSEAPTFAQLDRIIAAVRHALDHSRPVLVHCRGGVGRTATVLTPLLITLTGASLDQAVASLKKAGRFTQSMHQWEFLLEWTRRNASAPGISPS